MLRPTFSSSCCRCNIHLDLWRHGSRWQYSCPTRELRPVRGNGQPSAIFAIDRKSVAALPAPERSRKLFDRGVVGEGHRLLREIEALDLRAALLRPVHIRREGDQRLISFDAADAGAATKGGIEKLEWSAC